MIIDALWTVLHTIQNFGYAKLLATASCLGIAYRILHALYLSPLRNIPGPFLARLTTKRFEIIGASGLLDKYARSEPIVYGDIYVYGPSAVVISHPTDVRTVLGSHSFRKSEFYHALDVAGSENTISTRNPELSRMRRRQLGPYFNPSYLAKMEGQITQNGILALKTKWDSQLAESVNGKTEINFYKDYLYATFDTIGALAFGREFNALKSNGRTMIEWVGDSISYLGTTAFSPILAYYPFSLLLSRWECSYNSLITYANESIRMRREFLAGTSSEDKPVDMLQALIDAEDPETKTRLTNTQVLSESITLLLAGSETSSNTMMWTIHLLMLHPQYYQRAVDEVRGKVDSGHLISYNEARAGLPFLEACIYEAMRVIPVSGGLWPRVSPKGGVSIQGHYLPAGTEIYVNASRVNISPAVWDRPLEFDPTRFLDNEEARHNMFTFSSGVRICPGRHLAWMEMLIILANTLRDYDIAFPKDYTLRGPNVLDESGNPKLLDSLHHVVVLPQDSERDCRVVISKRS